MQGTVPCTAPLSEAFALCLAPEQAIAHVGPEPRLNAAAVLVGQQRAALTQSIAMLEERLAGVVAQLKASRVSLQRYAEVNRSVHAELVEAGCLELAEAKHKLWRVETEMCDGISRRLGERADTDAGLALALTPTWPSPNPDPSVTLTLGLTLTLPLALT